MSRTVLTPGNFDGVHRGHQALVNAARRRADANGWRAVGMFFDPHPAAYFAPDRAPPLLTSPLRRVELLRAYGLDEVDVRRFDATFAAQSAEDFVRQVLVQDHRVGAVVVGPDFRFGRGRAGDQELLSLLGRRLGFEVQVVPAVEVDGDVVSSTRARRLVTEGRMGEVAALLGRPHETEGEVVRGDGRGRRIGFPTANLRLTGLAPADGVYAVAARVRGRKDTLRGVANVGTRPTFDAGRSIEVHLFDVNEDLYDEVLQVAWIERLRPEQKFASVEALLAQLARDVEAGRRIAEERELSWI